MKRNIRKRYIFTAFVLLLTITGCGGGGGGGSSDSVVNEFSASNSGDPISDPASDPSSDPGSDPVDTSVILSWDEPITNSDGSQLTDLAGYKVYYGTSSHNYLPPIDVGMTTDAAISNLSPGTWCFAVTAYDTSGNESDYSDEVCL